MKVILKNCSLVFQTNTPPEPEVVPMTSKSSTRLRSQIYTKNEFKDYVYYISDTDASTYEILVAFSDNSEMSGESFVEENSRQAWSDLSENVKSKSYFQIICRRKDNGNLSSSDVTLYKIAE